MTQQPFRLESESNYVAASVCLQSFKDSRFMMGAYLTQCLGIIFFILLWLKAVGN